MPVPASHTFALTASQADALESGCVTGFDLHDVPYARVGARKPGLSSRFTQKVPKSLSKVRNAADFITFTLEPEFLGEARIGYEEILDPAQFEPHFGIDESGKGDFFGPLVLPVFTRTPRSPVR